MGVDTLNADVVRKAVLSVLYENRKEELSVERIFIKVLRHMLPKMPEESLVKSVIDKLAKEGHVDFGKDLSGCTVVKLSSKGMELSEKEREQFKRRIDELATKLSNAQ